MLWYPLQNIHEIDSPALVVYPDRIAANIDSMIHHTGGPERLQPHVKTYKMQEVVAMQMAKGITKFKFATISEGEMLGRAGVKEALLAYQPVGPKVHRLLALVREFPDTRFSALVDHPDAARTLSALFESADMILDVYLDIDVGMHRTGIAPDSNALSLFILCRELTGIQPVGLHLYDGHLHISDWNERKKGCDTAFDLGHALAKRIEKATGVSPILVAGGTPTFPIHAKREGVICSPGTLLLWDWGYGKMLPELEFQFAALVICRIFSKIESHLICVDLGHKSIAAENPHPRVHFLNLPDATPFLQSEEHLVLDVGDNSQYPIGMVLYGVPIHICPTTALYERAFVAKGGKVTGECRVVARDRKTTF